MTQEEKQLLNRTLLCLLPYNTKVSIDFESYVAWLPDDSDDDKIPYKENLRICLENRNKSIVDISKVPLVLCAYVCNERFQMMGGLDNKEYGVPVEFIKPYLRPVSSMTDEEIETYESFITSIATDETGAWELIDWLNEHYFDYRGLIEKGLAIKVTEENNPYKD